MRKYLVPALAALGAAAVVVGVGLGALAAGPNSEEFEFSVGLWGDMPYNDVQATVGVPNIIADMNASNLAFSVHDGDLKAGNNVRGSVTPTDCSDPLYEQGLAYLNRLARPAMFTPGDNDWTDCDRARNGGFNSLERLDHERAVFFSTPFSQGQVRLRQQVQTAALCVSNGDVPVVRPTAASTTESNTTVHTPAPCVENRRWTYEGVTFATVNVQGSSNNLSDNNPDPVEFAARNAANIQWLKDTFAQATAKGSAAVMIIGQADPGFDGSDGTRAPLRNPKTLGELTSTGAAVAPELDGYKDFLVTLRDLTVAYRKPVVYAHGDSHYFRVDKPLQNAAGRRVENFTRVETYGDNVQNLASDPAGDVNDSHWVKVLVDPLSRDVFAFQPQVVPGNRVAVPAP